MQEALDLLCHGLLVVHPFLFLIQVVHLESAHLYPFLPQAFLSPLMGH